MDRFAEFLRAQIDADLNNLQTLREQIEQGSSEEPYVDVVRGFRECELKSRLLRMHHDCGRGSGPCDRAGTAYPSEDERGCPTRALIGLPYTDRTGYRQRWRP